MNAFSAKSIENRKNKLLWKLPQKIKDKFQWDDESIYSFTSLQIGSELCEALELPEDMHVLDATAGTGGNSIAFARYFRYVTAVEPDENRFKMLKNNLAAAGFDNVQYINDQYQNIAIDAKENTPNIVFFDPPWGGPDYKNYPEGTLRLVLPGDRPTALEDLMVDLPEAVDFCIVKLPINYDTEHLLTTVKVRWTEYYRIQWPKPNSHIVIAFR